MKRTMSTLAGSTLIALALSACGGSSGPTFADVKDSSTAEQACKNAFGDDKDKLKKLVPADTDPSAKFRVLGNRDGHNLVCEIRSQSEHTEITFSPEDGGGEGNLNSHQGSLYGWAGIDTSAPYPDGAQGVLDDATKALAG